MSKVAQDMMGYQYFMSYGLPIIHLRANALGWEGEIPFERTLNDLLAYWRQRTMSSAR